jgi:hypothetical protein
MRRLLSFVNIIPGSDPSSLIGVGKSAMPFSVAKWPSL